MADKDQDLTTIFICFLKAGFRFTRNDTNIVGLRFAEELRKSNPDFKPTKIEQREFTKHFIVNGYPKAFEPVIMDLVLEYGKQHQLEHRMKKNQRSGGGFQRRPNHNRGYSSHTPYRSERGSSFRDDRTGGSSRENRFGNRDEKRYPGTDRSDDRRPKRRRIYRPGSGDSGRTDSGNPNES